MGKLAVGIDLGTTNSVVSFAQVKRNGTVKANVLELPRASDMCTDARGKTLVTTQRAKTLPSCVYYKSSDGGKPIVGDYARHMYDLHPRLVAKSIKSQMGKELAEGLSEDVQDKSPAQISSRILQHIVQQASKLVNTSISDAIITVPANFDSAMCQATLAAAKMAGITVENADGTERHILLSEPNAVLYDLINMMENEELPETLIDLSKKRNIMVFDLGGGTLDITLHTTELRPGSDRFVKVKVNEIATNRYTLLGGDNFDEAIAEVMYDRFLKQYASYTECVNTIKREKEIVMAKLRTYAENLKIELNEKCSGNEGLDYVSAWDIESENVDDMVFPVGGSMGGLGVNYDDNFTKKEVEKMLEPLLGYGFKIEDYRHVNQIKDVKNIIYPILDVYAKGEAKLGEPVHVDAVVLNGGMSKFYLVQERLEEFFGIKPIVVTDPDLSVARGAAIYHYYLQQDEELAEDMVNVTADENVKNMSAASIKQSVRPKVSVGATSSSGAQDRVKATKPVEVKHVSPIEFGNTILNDTLYLGLRNGNVVSLIATGQELPYESEEQKGYKLDINQDKILFPIKSQNLDGTYRTIATGEICFERPHTSTSYVTLQVRMNRNKIITMSAWTSSDPEGKEILQQGFCDIVIGNKESQGRRGKLTSLPGIKLNVNNELHQLEQLCTSSNKKKSGPVQSKEKAEKIKVILSGIMSSGNKDEFASGILNKLSRSRNVDYRTRLFHLSRRLSPYWNKSEKEELCNHAYDVLAGIMNGFMPHGPSVNECNAAIMVLSCSEEKFQIDAVFELRSNPKFYQAILFMCGHTGSHVVWLAQELEKAIDAYKMGKDKHGLPEVLYATSLAFSKHEEDYKHNLRMDILESVLRLIYRGSHATHITDMLLFSMAYLGDQRFSAHLPSNIYDSCVKVLDRIDSRCSSEGTPIRKLSGIARKMISGIALNSEEEKYLLEQVEERF